MCIRDRARGLGVIRCCPKIAGRAAVQDLGEGLLLGLGSDVLLMEGVVVRLGFLLLRFQAA